MKRFTKCAYFDYQREKVFFRTDENVRKSVRRKKIMTKVALRINETVACGPPKKCPKCKKLKST